jgi:hypothetical protein
MQRISTDTRQIDKFGPGKDGFTDGNVGTGQPTTQLEAKWFDTEQEELANLVEIGGRFALNPTDNQQVLKSIQQMITEATILPPDLTLYVRKAGDVMSGTLTIGDATSAPGAAGGIRYNGVGSGGGNVIGFQWAGGGVFNLYVDTNLIGPIALTSQLAAYLPIAGGTMTGFLTLFGAPTTNAHAATKLYVDQGDAALAAQDALRVLKTGDTMTGNLTMGTGTWGIIYNGVTGVDAIGFTFQGALDQTGHILGVVNGTYIGPLAWTSELLAYLPLSGGTLVGQLGISRAGDNFDLAGSGSLSIYSPGNQALISLGHPGGGTGYGVNIGLGPTEVEIGGHSFTRRAFVFGPTGGFNCLDAITCGGSLRAFASIAAVGGSFGLGYNDGILVPHGGDVRSYHFLDTCGLALDNNPDAQFQTVQLIWGGVSNWTSDAGGSFTIRGTYVGGGLPFGVATADYTPGLDAIMQLQPQAYQDATGQISVGLDESNVAAVLPDSVRAQIAPILMRDDDTPRDDAPVAGINQTALLMTAINAIKELGTRLEALETERRV